MKKSKTSSGGEPIEKQACRKEKAPRKRRLLRGLLVALALLILLGGAELLWSNYHISVSRYTLSSPKIAAPIRVVFLSDLHGREFGGGNQRLLEQIAAQEPDLIALVGDIFNEDAEAAEIDAMCGFIHACTEIAPCYFGLGNHETSYLETDAAGLLDRIREAGAVVVNDEFQDITVNGNPIRLGGYMGYYPYPHMMTHDPELIQKEKDFFGAFKRTESFKLLLDHIPTGWLDWHYINKDSIDLVLSGHYHGGVIRIPILEQGLYAPYIGKFPPYTKGMFVGSKATCILTTGMAGSYGLPRFFNPPEICVVDLYPKD